MKAYWNRPSFFGIVVLGILFLRGILNGMFPFIDGIEARYAEMARVMAENDNWTMESMNSEVFFLTNIPLFIRLSAFSFELFGVYEFTARLPSFLAAISFVFLLGKYGKRNGVPFFLPGFILCTIPEFLIHAGMVATDMLLAFCIAVTLLSFWEALQDHARWYWKYLIIIGLGIGFLAKGFVVVALTIPPMIAWSICYKKTACVLQRIPFIIGIMLIFSGSTLWYVMTTGMISGQEDDPWNALGILCSLVLCLSMFWIPVILYKIWKYGETLRANEWLMFLLFWLLWTPLVFIFLEDFLDAYVLFLIAPITLLVTYWFPSFRYKKMLIKMGMSISVFLLLMGGVGMYLGHIQYFASTDKYLIQDNVQVGYKIYHVHSKSYSSQFYTEGAIATITIKELEEKIRDNRDAFRVIIPHEAFEKIAIVTRKKLQPLDKNYSKGIYGYYKK